LHIGASTTIANYILPNKLTGFLQQNPSINLELTALNTKQCIEQLLNFEIDIAFVEGVHLHPKISLKPWLTDRLYVFCHPKHPLAKKTKIKLTELSDYPWALREATSGTRQVLESALQQSPVDLPNLTIINSSQAIKNFVKHNPLALACLSEAVIADDLAAKKLVKLNIRQWQLKRHFYQACYQNKSDSKLLQCLEQYLWSKNN
jgi:DNA-binding transcriptional LysR family regulator